MPTTPHCSPTWRPRAIHHLSWVLSVLSFRYLPGAYKQWSLRVLVLGPENNGASGKYDSMTCVCRGKAHSLVFSSHGGR